MATNVKRHVDDEVGLEMPPPKEIADIGPLEIDALDSMMMDASEAVQRYTKFQQSLQESQQGVQQAQIDLAGLSKAVEKLIQAIVRSHGLAGTYVYDKDNKKLVLK